MWASRVRDTSTVCRGPATPLRLLAALAALLLVAGCTGGPPAPSRTLAPTGAPTSPARPGPPTMLGGGPGLSGVGPCPDFPEFTCADFGVPIDHTGHRPGLLRLRVAMGTNSAAPRGVLLVLAGGPGQAALPLLRRLVDTFGPLLADYRLVILDQRGTGAEALDCPELQQALGKPEPYPPPGATAACAARLGPDVRYYTTADTVADLDRLRTALGVEKLTLDGVSYGSFVAARYALAHPDRVSRLVLDSVVPHHGVDLTGQANMRAAGTVLRDVCQQRTCLFDVAADLASVLAGRDDDGLLLDTLSLYSVVDPRFTGVPEAIHAASLGQPGALEPLYAKYAQWNAEPKDRQSAGLFAATLCADSPAPWGNAATPVAARGQGLDRLAGSLPSAAVWPFQPDSVRQNSYARMCLDWPPVPPPADPGRTRIPASIPTLLLQGARDISTPVEDARAQRELAPHATLAVVPEAGHSVQVRAEDNAGRTAVARFLTGP